MARTCGRGVRQAVAGCAAAVFLSVAASAGGGADGTNGDRGVLFSGTDIMQGAMYSYYGVIASLNHSLSRDGWAIRAYGSLDDYDTDPGDGRGWQGDVMLGYYFNRHGFVTGIFAGADYQNWDDDSGTSIVQGSEWGAKVAAEIETVEGSPVYLGLEGSYSTAFDSYYARARVGAHRNQFTVGPEVMAVGNEDYDATRLGAFVTFHSLNPFRLRPFDLTLAAGHQWVSSDTDFGAGGEDGAYGSISFITPF